MARSKKRQRQLRALDILFRELPAEIRNIVYAYIFTGATLNLDYDKHIVATVRSRRILKQINVQQLLQLISDNKGALLLASKFYRTEGLQMLASFTKVELENGEDERNDMLAVIDQDFMRHVPSIQMHPDTFIRTDRTLLSNLKEVTLSCKLELSNPLAHSPGDFVHIITCPHCGDGDGSWFYHLYGHRVYSWDWKRKQLLYLAKEGGWTTKLILYTEWNRSTRPFPDGTRLEFEYELEAEKLVTRRMLRSGKVVISGDEFTPARKLQQALQREGLGYGDDSDDDSDDY